MTSPRYARATTSSSLKASPKSTKTFDADSHVVNTRGLKRPALLTTTKRNRMLYLRDLIPIKPRNKSEPCHLATLPSELRMEIYSYVLFDDVFRFPEVLIFYERKWVYEPKYIWPSLLHVCRAIRIEAAYAYYTSAPFSWHIRNLDFSPVTKWVDMLPREHRALLARNRKMQIDIVPNFTDALTYPPPGYLIDDFQEAHWKQCEPFGNLYSLKSDQHRKHFIAFCRLASWWSWCTRPACKDIQWSYTFGDCFMVQSKYGTTFGVERQLNRFVQAAVIAISAPYVTRAWTRRNHRASMKQKAKEWVAAMDRWWEQKADITKIDEQTEWHGSMGHIKAAIESW